MPEPALAKEPLIRNISDTARWAAIHRAVETDRRDALFRDPFARKLAGPRGEEIHRQMPRPGGEWSWALRTYLFDRAILGAIEKGVDTVVNLAAGLDARPYRMPLPHTLQWIEVDLPAILEEKEEVLRGERPICRLERVPLNLADVPARQKLFARIGGAGRHVLILTEGLLIYLAPPEVAALARDLAAPVAFRRWVLDIGSPGLLKLMQKSFGNRLEQAGSPFKFAPPEGPEFFEPAGWKAVEVHSILKNAAKAGRLPFLLRLVALLPESSGRQGKRPWSGVCVLERSQ